MKNSRRNVLKIGLAAGLAVSVGLVANAAAAWEPKKPVDFVIMAGKGGGADKAVRLMQSIIAKHKMAPVPVTPINKPGGTGAEALVYMQQKAGDDHTIMFTLNSFYTTPLRQPALGIDIATSSPCPGRPAIPATGSFSVAVEKQGATASGVPARRSRPAAAARGGRTIRRRVASAR